MYLPDWRVMFRLYLQCDQRRMIRVYSHTRESYSLKMYDSSHLLCFLRRSVVQFGQTNHAINGIPNL